MAITSAHGEAVATTWPGRACSSRSLIVGRMTRPELQRLPDDLTQFFRVNANGAAIPVRYYQAAREHWGGFKWEAASFD
jgi:hypothetical protein